MHSFGKMGVLAQHEIGKIGATMERGDVKEAKRVRVMCGRGDGVADQIFAVGEEEGAVGVFFDQVLQGIGNVASRVGGNEIGNEKKSGLFYRKVPFA